MESPTWHALFAPHVPSPEAMTNLKQELQSDMTSQAQSTSTVFILCFSLLSGLCPQCSQPKVPASVPPTNPNRFFECFHTNSKDTQTKTHNLRYFQLDDKHVWEPVEQAAQCVSLKFIWTNYGNRVSRERPPDWAHPQNHLKL